MTTLEISRPRRRAFWGDARFFIGVALVVVAIAGVWFVVTSARQTVPVMAAARTIVPGDELSTGDLRMVEAALGATADAYLSPDAWEPGAVATRTIEAGELVPASAVGDASSVRVTTVVVRSATDVPSGVTAGTVIELWAAPLLEHGLYGTPSILVADATVAAVTVDEAMIGVGSASLELVIERSDVAKTLEAVGADAALSVVPTGAIR